MRKRFLESCICATAVLATIGMMLIGASYSESTDTNQVSSIELKFDTETITTSVPIKETDEDELPESKVSKEPDEIYTSAETQNNALYSASQFMILGNIHWNGWNWTYYSEKVLLGGGLDIPGRHNDENGYVCDENGYICLSSSSLSRGTVIDTPFGKRGKVYDTGCPPDVVDVYVNW